MIAEAVYMVTVQHKDEYMRLSEETILVYSKGENVYRDMMSELSARGLANSEIVEKVRIR